MKRMLSCALLGATLAVTGCDTGEEAGGDPQFLGALSANVSTFTTSPGGCVVSAIFDDDRVEWRPGETAANGRTTKARKRGLTLAVPASAAGATVKVDVRGSYMTAGSGASAAATLSVAGRSTAIRLPDGKAQNEYFQSVAAPIPAGARTVAVMIETSAPKPEDPAAEVTLDVDSLDIALDSKPACGRPAGG
ncbi:MAG TPA: hypothetical protein VEW26_08970 [Allosphingosinicella sp.]|nr:hypothetical protein [Allosphingosinicella sp.]